MSNEPQDPPSIPVKDLVKYLEELRTIAREESGNAVMSFYYLGKIAGYEALLDLLTASTKLMASREAEAAEMLRREEEAIQMDLSKIYIWASEEIGRLHAERLPTARITLPVQHYRAYKESMERDWPVSAPRPEPTLYNVPLSPIYGTSQACLYIAEYPAEPYKILPL